MAEKINKIKKIVFLIVGLGLSVLTMVLVFFLAGYSSAKDNEKTSLFLAMSIMSEVLFQIFLFIKYPNKKDRIRVSIVAFVYLVSAILAFFAKGNYRFYYFSTFGVVTSLGLSFILRIFIHNKETTKIGSFTNALAGIVLIAFAVSLLINIKEADAIYITIVDVVILLFISMKNIIVPTLRFSKVKLFLDILIQTHTLNVLLCLFAMIIAFSFLFPMFEENIPTYWDAMWYCFTVITTIGFGDFYAATVVGRVLTVLLGIYGIVVVSILTSVIVNYYGALTKKDKEGDKYIE